MHNTTSKPKKQTGSKKKISGLMAMTDTHSLQDQRKLPLSIQANVSHGLPASVRIVVCIKSKHGKPL